MKMSYNEDSVGKSSSSSSDTSDAASIEIPLQTNEGDKQIRRAKYSKEHKIIQVKGDRCAKVTFHAVQTQHLDAEAMVIRVSPDQSVYAVGMSNGDIRLFQLSELIPQDFVLRLKVNSETLPCTDLRFPPTGQYPPGRNKFTLLASYASGYVRLWHYTASSSKASLVCEWEEQAQNDSSTRTIVRDTHNQILCLSISFDNKRFVTGGTDTHIRVYDFTSKSCARLLQPSIRPDMTSGHTTRITALAYHPRGKRDTSYAHIFLSASWDDSIHIWDDQKAVSLWCYYGPHIAGNDGLDIDPVKNLILTCSWRRERTIVQLWKFADFLVEVGDVKSKREIQEYSNPITQFAYEPSMQMSQGYVAQFDPSYQYVVFAGTNENLVNILDVTSNTVLAEIKHLEYGVYSAAIYSDSDVKNRLKVIFTNGKSVSLGRISTCPLDSTFRNQSIEFSR